MLSSRWQGLVSSEEVVSVGVVSVVNELPSQIYRCGSIRRERSLRLSAWCKRPDARATGMRAGNACTRPNLKFMRALPRGQTGGVGSRFEPSAMRGWPGGLRPDSQWMREVLMRKPLSGHVSSCACSSASARLLKSPFSLPEPRVGRQPLLSRSGLPAEQPAC